MNTKNVALIFAGGTGKRMNSKAIPKQFLELHGKPIIIYTLEIFQNHEEIDSIVVVCIKSWIEHLKKLIEKYHLTKVIKVVPGGSTAQKSQYNGLKAIKENIDIQDDSTVLIHDGVRPLIDEETISKNIEAVKKYGNAITTTPAIETIIVAEEDKLVEALDRSKLKVAKAPQSFKYGEIIEAHNKAIKDELEFIDSASLMQHYGATLHLVEGQPQNIKITTPADFYIFRAMIDAKENSQIWGL